MSRGTDDSGQGDLFAINEARKPALRAALARMNERRQAHPDYEAVETDDRASTEKTAAPKPKEPEPIAAIRRSRRAKEVALNLDRDDRIIPSRFDQVGALDRCRRATRSG